MMKRHFLIILAIALSMNLGGCTSGGSKDADNTSSGSDAAKEASDELGSDDLGGGEKKEASAEGSDGLDGDALDKPADQPAGDQAAQAPPAGGKDELALDEGDPDNEFPEDVPADKKPDQVAKTDPAAPPPGDDPLFNDKPAADAPPPVADNPTASDSPAPPAATDPAAQPPIEEPVAGIETPAPAAPVASVSPLQKIKDAPYAAKDGTMLNRVFIGRKGDTVKDVSQKIYGADRSKDLKAWNPILKNRNVKVGDKIYYNSPKNPTDSAQMLTFYEDNGMAPQVYTTKEGDNIRKLSKEFLGSPESWKEVWETNKDVESKGELPANVSLKYWPDGTAVAANGAPNGGQPAPDQAAPPPPPVAENQPPPPPPPPQGLPEQPQQAPPPPPPPMQAVNEPPPPPPPQEKPASTPRKNPAAIAETKDDNDTMMTIALGGVALLAAVGFIVIRKNREKRVDLSQTQV